jgi:hypothetical protein
LFYCSLALLELRLQKTNPAEWENRTIQDRRGIKRREGKTTGATMPPSRGDGLQALMLS